MTSAWGDSIVTMERVLHFAADQSIVAAGTLDSTTVDTFFGASFTGAPAAGGQQNGPLVRPIGHLLIGARASAGAVAFDVIILGSLTGAVAQIEAIVAATQFRMIARNCYWPRMGVRIRNNAAIAQTIRWSVIWAPGPVAEVTVAV